MSVPNPNPASPEYLRKRQVGRNPIMIDPLFINAIYCGAAPAPNESQAIEDAIDEMFRKRLIVQEHGAFGIPMSSEAVLDFICDPQQPALYRLIAAYQAASFFVPLGELVLVTLIAAACSATQPSRVDAMKNSRGGASLPEGKRQELKVLLNKGFDHWYDNCGA